MKKKWIVTLIIILLGTTMGCGLLTEINDTIATQTARDDNTISLPDEGMNITENAQWPTYLPDDIPVLAGDIRTVMGSLETNLRLFYEPLSEEQIEQYVELCEKKGFAVKYLVYTREGFPDNSAEKIKAGDFDAVQFTKGDYYMRLEYGSDLATLDINVARATLKEQPTMVPWPEDIKASVPQPEQCWVRNIANLSYGGYQITCGYKDGNLRLEEYLQVLTALSFQEIDRLINDDNEIVYIILEDESISVKLSPHSPSSTITLQILPKSP